MQNSWVKLTQCKVALTKKTANIKEQKFFLFAWLRIHVIQLRKLSEADFKN